MSAIDSIKAFFVRRFSSDYKNEVDKLSGFSSFEQLAVEVKTAQGSSSALLAIQDYAFKACKDRMLALRDGRDIKLLPGEKAVGLENCIIGQAECMKEVYIQAKGLRHKIDPRTIAASSTTFQQLNRLGVLSEPNLIKEEAYNTLPLQVSDAYALGLKNRLLNWIKLAKVDLHNKGQKIADNPKILEANTLTKGLFESYESSDGSWTDPVERSNTDYETIKRAYEFLESNLLQDITENKPTDLPPPYNEICPSAAPPYPGDTNT